MESGSTPVLVPNIWAKENPKVYTQSRIELGTFCEAYAQLHDHGQHVSRERHQPGLPTPSISWQSCRSLPSPYTLCNGLNDKNLVKPRKTYFLTI